MAASGITPVTVLAGFFGSGKTRLLHRIVEDPRYENIAMLAGEWDEAPAVACACCRVTGDLVRTLRELHFQRAEGKVPDFRHVVIETTGLADPAPLLATLVEMPLVAARYSLAGVVTTVDGQHGMATLDAHPEALKQAAMADVQVITKCDLAAAHEVDVLEARLQDLNPGARRLRSSSGNVDPADLLATGLYRGQGQALDARGWLNAGAYRRFDAQRHDPSISSFAWTDEGERDWDEFEDALRTLLELRGERILRMKGLVHVRGEPGPRAVHAVQHTLYPSARLPAWPADGPMTRMVFIGRGLEGREIDGILKASPAPRIP